MDLVLYCIDTLLTSHAWDLAGVDHSSHMDGSACEQMPSLMHFVDTFLHCQHEKEDTIVLDLARILFVVRVDYIL